MQDNQLHANLSVEEAMHVATSLKLGSDITRDSKYQVVSHRTVVVGMGGGGGNEKKHYKMKNNKNKIYASY